MSQDYYNINDRKGKHLTERERYTIETLLQDGETPSEIALKLGRHKRTIEREIKRGTVKLLNSDLTYRDQYCADAGQRIHDEKGKNKGPDLKIGNDHKLAKYIEDKIIKGKYCYKPRDLTVHWPSSFAIKADKKDTVSGALTKPLVYNIPSIAD